MNVQTRENAARDSRFFGGLGIDCVRKEWQNTVGVRPMFAKTGGFPASYLGHPVKTELRPAPVARDEARTTSVERNA